MGILSNTRVGQLFKGRSPEVTQPASPAANFMLSAVWVIGGILTVAIPAIYRTVKMNDYRKMYYMWNWEEAQKQYEEQQQQYWQNKYGNQWNGQGNYQYQWEQRTGTWDINQCKWWQLNCFPFYINENGEPEPAAGWYPSWFSGWTVTEDEREQWLENGETSAALKFVYAWQIIMFAAIIIYGVVVIRQNRIVSGLIVALVVFANMSFLSMWMLADGSIITDGEYVQQIGFYGQFPVLMFITNAWYVAFGMIFTIVLALRGHAMHEPRPAKQVEEPSHYKSMEAEEEPLSKDNSERSADDDFVKVV
ncbi:hypothetical protein IV203_016064 [Nitzschia inconspicua]|uniref:Uncharacterized protein n=1 Tax=Nitzschia inconspicua TaxID=303405 RepID=A0A9K3KPB3_9STRA|nr:hypothetical protein IV203_016064 [Nitzschia inconspicua]